MSFQEREYEWFIQYEIPRTVDQLKSVLEECITKLPVPVAEAESNDAPKAEKYVLASPASGADSLKCIVTLCGDNVTQAVS
jgi:hypothetical protein